QGSYNPISGVWSVGTVGTLLARTLVITARVDSSGTVTNTATLSHSDTYDPNTGNNQASVSETPQQADLKVTKSVSNTRPNIGDTLIYTVTLTNTGPKVATSVKVTDVLPGGLTFNSATPSQGTYNNISGLWDVGTLANGAVVTLQIRATVNSPDAQFNS